MLHGLSSQQEYYNYSQPMSQLLRETSKDPRYAEHHILRYAAGTQVQVEVKKIYFQKNASVQNM